MFCFFVVFFFFQKYSRNFRKRKSEINVNVISPKIQIVVNTPSGRIKTPHSTSKRGSTQLNTTENDTPKRKKYSSARKSNLQASFFGSPDIFDKTTTKKTPKKSLNKSPFILKETSTPKNKNLQKKNYSSQIPSKLPVKINLLMVKNNLTTQTRIKASINTPKPVAALHKTPLDKSLKKSLSTLEETKVQTPFKSKQIENSNKTNIPKMPKNASTLAKTPLVSSSKKTPLSKITSTPKTPKNVSTLTKTPLISSSKKSFTSLGLTKASDEKNSTKLVSKNKKSPPRSSSKNETNGESNLQLEPSNKSLSLTGKRYSQGTKDINLDSPSSSSKF